MAELNFPSMFDTRQAMDRQMQEDAHKAGVAAWGGKRYGMYYNSSLLGDQDIAFKRSIGGMFGIGGDPRMQQQQALDEIMAQFPNPQTPEDFVEISNALGGVGLHSYAEAAMDMANETRTSMPTPTKPTAAIENYERAVEGGYTGTFFDYQKALKAGDKNVSIGSIPQDFIVTTDDKGNITMEVIPGSPTDIANKEKIAAEQEGGVIRTVQKTVVVEDIDRLKKKITDAPWYNPVAGTILAKFLENPYIGAGKNRIDAESLATTIKSSIGFDRLQQMRDESPTGGALGQVSELELVTLQATLGSLSLDQSEKQLLKNLDRLAKIYQDMLKKIAETGDGTFNQKMYGSGGTSAAGSASSVDNDPFKIR